MDLTVTDAEFVEKNGIRSRKHLKQKKAIVFIVCIFKIFFPTYNCNNSERYNQGW